MTVATVTHPAARSIHLALLWVTLGGSFTGFSPIFVRLSETGPLATGGWRMAIAAIALAPFLGLARKNVGQTRGWPTLRTGASGFGLIILAGLFFAIDIGFYNASLGFTGVAHATLIVNLAPLVAFAAGFLLFGERFGVLKLAALCLSLAGAAVMTLGRASVSGTLEGNALAATGMLGYALYLIAVKQARSRHDATTIMVWSSICCTIILFAAAAVKGENLLPPSPEGWLVIVSMGLVTHVAGQGLVAIGMREAPVGIASILLLTQPVVAAVSAWAFFGENMGATELGGVALVLCGIVLAARVRG